MHVHVQEGNKSILDIDPGAQALLELVGKKMHSDGLRQEDKALPSEDHLYPL
jgi:hypothetical protein